MIFISGTDTNVGKTLVSSWLCLHLGYAYFKPIQTGLIEGRDSDVVQALSAATIYPEAYCYQAPVSPHLAAELEARPIDMTSIKLPANSRLIVEGAGGVLVPLCQNRLMVDLMKHLHLPVILVASTRVGTINHTLLSLEALRARKVQVLGVVMTGDESRANQAAIERYGDVPVLAVLPWLSTVNQSTLWDIPLTQSLSDILVTNGFSVFCAT